MVLWHAFPSKYQLTVVQIRPVEPTPSAAPPVPSTSARQAENSFDRDARRAGLLASECSRELSGSSSDVLKGLKETLKVSDADFDGFDRPLCLENTRVSIRDEIFAWARSESEENVYLLSGTAGSGKSTIAQTMADRVRLLRVVDGGSTYPCPH